MEIIVIPIVENRLKEMILSVVVYSYEIDARYRIILKLVEWVDY